MQSNDISPEKQALPSDEWYTSCKTLPLFNFIRFIETDELKWLVIKGEPSKEQLRAAWSEIYTEYIDIMKDDMSVHLLSLLKQITFLSNKLHMAEHLRSVGYLEYNEGAVKLLNELGYRQQYPKDDIEKYRADMNRVAALSKKDWIELARLQTELKEFQKKKDTGEARFESTLVALSRYQGYKIDTKNTTVAEYIAIIKDFERNGGKNR